MNDLQQVSLCLRQVTSRSLVLIDEFGKGTNDSGLSLCSESIVFLQKLIGKDGIGLACGTFEYLLSRKDPAKVIAATHFHEIFENNFLERRPQLQLGHMEVQVSEEPGESDDQVTYLYKYVLYTTYHTLDLMLIENFIAFALVAATRALAPCTSSLPSGLSHRPHFKLLTWYSCAAINGIDPVVVSRANEITHLLARGENIVAACAALLPGEMKDLEEAVTVNNISKLTTQLTGRNRTCLRETS